MNANPAFLAGVSDAKGFIFQLMPVIVIFAIFYFLLIRPQKKRQAEHQLKLAAIAKGDKVLTAGGIEGLVKKASENHIDVEISKGVIVSVVRSTVLDVVKK